MKVVTDEIVTKNLKAQHAVFGSSEKPEGVTMYDQYGKAGCLLAANVDTGSMKLVAGECNGATPLSPVPVPVPLPTQTATTSLSDAPAQIASSSVPTPDASSAATSTQGPAH
ncbi:MAG: hypothetical protein HY007_02580 [Candidatus Sungbacteria bacterium]|nr:hypothetical protein [Candidatus Sungbacteria bacterium]